MATNITQDISTFPPAPDSNTDTPTEFNSKADAFVSHQAGTYVGEVNTWASQANAVSDEVNNLLATLPDGTIDDSIITSTNTWSAEKLNNDIAGLGQISGRNVLINGEVSRINQRGFDGVSWVEGEYGFDRWFGTATGISQIIEVHNYKHDTVYTLSGLGVTTQQIVSPSSGDWLLPTIPSTARDVQLEEGVTATIFEKRIYAYDLMMCQRYYYASPIEENVAMGLENVTGTTRTVNVSFKVTMRVIPVISNLTTNAGIITSSRESEAGFRARTTGNTTTDTAFVNSYIADAEIN